MATLQELKIKFSVDMSEYKAKMNQAAEAARNVQTKIDGLGESLKTTGGLSTSEVSKLGRTLSTAGQQAARLGKQAQSLATDEGNLGRAIQEQLGKAAELGQEYDELKAQTDRLSNISKTVKNAVGELDLSTPLEQQLEAAKTAVQEFDAQIEDIKASIAASTQGGYDLVSMPDGSFANLAQANQALDAMVEKSAQAGERLERLQTAINSIGTENLGYASTKGLQQLDAEIIKNTSRMGRLRSQIAQTQNTATTFGQRLEQVRTAQRENVTATQELDSRVDTLGAALRQSSSGMSRLAAAGKTAASAVSGVAGRMAMLAKNAAGAAFSSIASRIRSIGNGAKSASSGGLNSMVRQIRNIGVVSLGLRLCSSLFGQLRSVVSYYVNTNEDLYASVTRLKNGLGQALAPAINVVINAVSKLLPYLVGVADAVASLLTNIFGKGWTSVSTGASSAADAVDDVTDATDDAADAQEAYNRTLAGFDKITKLDSNSSSSGSSGSGSGATTSTTDSTEGIAGILPEWLANIADLIENSEWAELGTYLADCLGSAVDQIYNILTSEETYAKVDSAVSALTTTVNSFFKEMNLVDDETGDSIASKIGKTIGAAINLGAYTVNSVVTGIDWSEIGLTVANGINGAVEETNWSQLGTTIANVFLALPKTLYSVIVNTDWGEIAKGLSEMLVSAVNSLSSFLQEMNGTEVANALFDFIAGIDYGGIAQALLEGLASAFALGAETLAVLGDNIAQGLANGIVAFFIDIGEWVNENILQPFISGVKSVFGIASPAKNEEVVGAGKNIALGILNGIAAPFLAIGEWVDENIFTPIRNALTGGGDTELSVQAAVELVKSGWDTVTDWIGSIPAVSAAVKLAKSGWSSISDWIGSNPTIQTLVKLGKSGWSSVTTWVGNNKTVQTAVKLVKTGWSSLVTYIGNNKTVQAGVKLVKKGWSSLSSFIGSFTKSIGLKLTWKTSGLGTLQKAVATALFGSAKWPQLKFAARGGIVDRATLFGNTVVGEAGQEAIVPLERNTQWADIVAEQIAGKLSSSGEGGGSQTINVNVVLDGKVVGRSVVEYATNYARTYGQLPWAAYT